MARFATLQRNRWVWLWPGILLFGVLGGWAITGTPLTPTAAEADAPVQSAAESISAPASSLYEETAMPTSPLSAAALQQMLQQETAPLLLDVRTDQEYAEGHIPGAVLLPYDLITDHTASTLAPSRTQPIVVYCRSGRRSALAAETLADLGYTTIYDFGTLANWIYEIDRSDPSPEAPAAEAVTPPSYAHIPYLAEHRPGPAASSETNG